MARASLRGTAAALVGLFLLLVGVLITVVLMRTYTSPKKHIIWQGQRAQEAKLGDREIKQLKQALIGAVRIPTVSFSEEEQNTTALAEFGNYIRKVFPQVFSSSFIQHEVVGHYSHLFTVRGLDDSLMPYMILAHLDVVPAQGKGWTFPPFSGEEHDGYIYGRGTLDDKSCVIGVIQALEFLLNKGYRPQRSFYIGLGHDEEVSGHKGAMKIVEKLQSRNVKLVFVVDEGLAVLDGVFAGVDKTVALVGTTEKGSITLNLTVNQPPGHSSMPPAETSIGILAAAVSRLEKNPMPNVFGEGPEASMFELLSGEFHFPLNILMSNLWLFSPMISRFLERTASGNAIVRTTTALTIFNSGLKSNVIPQMAIATVNFRLHPAQTVHKVLEIVRTTINDERVELSVLNSFDPLPISPYDDLNFGYQMLKHTIRSVFPGVPIAPGVCIGNTDSRHYVNLTDSIYRFSPFVLRPEDLGRIHGLDERISLENLKHVVQFYYQLIQNADCDKVPIINQTNEEL